MDITQTVSGGLMHLAVAGRIDGYWADHLSVTLNEVVQQGHHRIRLDCSKVTFLSSAGIGVLVQFHNDLKDINGAFHVVNPSTAVATILQMTRLADILIDAAAPTESPVETPRKARRVDRNGLVLEIFDLEAGAELTCRTIGSPDPLATGSVPSTGCTTLGPEPPSFAVGVGAFGDSFDDCRTRFGELLAVGGTTVYQPADGTNVADYLLAAESMSAKVRVLYAVAGQGRFRHLIHFETVKPTAATGLSSLVAACLEQAATESIGMVMVAEAAGLIGAALRRSPASPGEEGDLFEYPDVKKSLSFTAEQAFPESVALVGGVVTRRPTANHAQLRPIGNGLFGHFHAAAFRFHPVRKGFVELAPTVTSLFDDQRLLGVLHLLHDDRRPTGAGESAFIRGACWIGPVAAGWLDT